MPPSLEPSGRGHRGAHPQDAELFADAQHSILRQAVADFSWLLSREYPFQAALKLVGDRYALKERQRSALGRASCSDAQREQRLRREVSNLAGEALAIDGFNLLISVEAALSGGVLLESRDGCIRDLASVHGTYRSVAATELAIATIGERLNRTKLQNVTWYLDQPISNSGRLAQMLREKAEAKAWPWQVELVPDPDRVLRESQDVIVVSSDSHILDAPVRWFNLTKALLRSDISKAWLVQLNSAPAAGG